MNDASTRPYRLLRARNSWRWLDFVLGFAIAICAFPSSALSNLYLYADPTFGGYGTDYSGSYPYFSFSGTPDSRAVCDRIAPMFAGDDGSPGYCKGIGGVPSSPSTMDWVQYVYFLRNWGGGDWHEGSTAVMARYTATCPTGYAGFWPRSPVALSDFKCRKQKPCADVGTFSCVVKTEAGGSPIPSATIRNNCAMSVSVTGCVDRITKVGTAYSMVSYCNATETPTGGTTTSLPALNCATDTAPPQDPCSLPGSSCNQPNTPTCPAGFTLTGGSCALNPTNPDGCAAGTHQDTITSQCIADAKYAACPVGSHRNTTASGDLGACVKDADGGGGGGTGGTGGTGAGGVAPSDVKCGATGDLCQTKFQEYVDAVTGWFGVTPAIVTEGQNFQSQYADGKNALNTGKVVNVETTVGSRIAFGSTCPAPRMVNLKFTTVSVDYTQICSLATMIGPIVAAVMGLTAIGIILKGA